MQQCQSAAYCNSTGIVTGMAFVQPIVIMTQVHTCQHCGNDDLSQGWVSRAGRRQVRSSSRPYILLSPLSILFWVGHQESTCLYPQAVYLLQTRPGRCCGAINTSHVSSVQWSPARDFHVDHKAQNGRKKAQWSSFSEQVYRCHIYKTEDRKEPG